MVYILVYLNAEFIQWRDGSCILKYGKNKSYPYSSSNTNRKTYKNKKKNEQELRKTTYKLIYCLYFSSGKFSKPSVCSDVRPCACKLLPHKKSVWGCGSLLIKGQSSGYGLLLNIRAIIWMELMLSKQFIVFKGVHTK